MSHLKMGHSEKNQTLRALSPSLNPTHVPQEIDSLFHGGGRGRKLLRRRPCTAADLTRSLASWGPGGAPEPYPRCPLTNIATTGAMHGEDLKGKAKPPTSLERPVPSAIPATPRRRTAPGWRAKGVTNADTLPLNFGDTEIKTTTAEGRSGMFARVLR
jgi:hypothetical protein